MSSCKACSICGTDEDEADDRLGGSLATSEGRGRRRDRVAIRFLSFLVTVFHSDALIAQEMTMYKKRYRTSSSQQVLATGTIISLSSCGGWWYRCRFLFFMVWSVAVSFERRSTALPMSVCLYSYVCLMDSRSINKTENGSERMLYNQADRSDKKSLFIDAHFATGTHYGYCN